MDITDEKRRFRWNATVVRTAKRPFGPLIATQMVMVNTMKQKSLKES